MRERLIRAQQAIQQQQQYLGNPFLIGSPAGSGTARPRCVHANCPVCAKELKLKKAHEKSLAKRKTLKAEDYKRRCAEYMKKFRRNYAIRKATADNG